MVRPSPLRWLSALVVIAMTVSAMFYSTHIAAYEMVKGPAPIVDKDLRWSAYRRYSSTDGLPGNTVNALAQDKEGFVYAGTENGLAKFDGRAWHKIDLPTANQHSVILRLNVTDNGDIWIGTDDAGLFRYARGAVSPVPLPSGAAETDIEAIVSADSKSVYAGTSRALYRCDVRHCSEIVAGRGFEVSTLLVGEREGQECLWLGTNNDGLYRIDDLGTAATRAKRADWHLGGRELGAQPVRSLAQWGGNDARDLWVGTGRGLVRISHDVITAYAATPDESQNGVGTLLSGIASDGSHVLYAGLYTDGLAEIRLDGSWSIEHRSNGLPEEFLLSLLLTDPDLHIPVLWIGTQDSGIARRDAGVWSRFDERNGLPHHAIHGLGELEFLDGTRTQWIGTSGGAVRWQNHGWAAWFPPSVALGVVNTAIRSDDKLWIGSDSGLSRILNAGAKTFTLTNSGLPGTVVEALASEEHGSNGAVVWVGTHHGLAHVIDGTIEVTPVPPLGHEPAIRAFAQTSTSKEKLLWAGGDSGLAYRIGDTWFGLAEECRSSTDELLDLREQGTPGNSHYLWVANRDGITRIDLDNGFTCAQPPESILRPETIYNVQIDHAQRLYLFGKQGVIRLTPDPLAPDDLSKFKVERFGLDSGLPTLEFNRGSLVDDQGRIWASSVEGAVLYDPREESPPPRARPFRLLSARVDGAASQISSDAVLNADENTIVFDVSLLSFQRDRLTRYRTELVGSDESESGWVPEGRRVYQRLPAGDYTFHAYARDGFGIEAEPLSMHFSIRPPFWRQWWAIALYVLAIVTLSAGISRWRIQRVRIASKILEHTVAERTTSLKIANTQLEEANQAAEAATQAKSVFLANMSHEIRTPMNAVLGFAGLGMRLDIPAKANDYFRKINNAGQNLLNILNDILDFSKIEAGKLALETVPFSLADVLTQVTDLFTLKASEKNIEFVVGTAPGIPDHYVGDPLRLGQVLLNLVNNAIKFTQAGFVQVYVEEVGTGRQNDKAFLRFIVEDSGIGMSSDQIAKLFQPFAQADHSTTRHFGGTGLGLTISQRLVAQMGGVISVRSHLGAGSCFQFEIRMKLQDSGPKPHRLAPDEFAGLNILVVDDSEQAREWLSEQLIALRFRVVTVDSGEAALAILRRERFDLIMMDWMMPGIDGIETTRRIKSDINLSRIPEVIMVTAYGREAIQEAAESVGVRRFLIKPVNPSVLLDTVVETLGAGSLSAAAARRESIPESASFSGIAVLLVEDNLVNQQLAIDMLSGAAIRVDVASNGIEALKSVQNSAYDLILMDIEMPEMDGYTAARKIVKRLGSAAPPIIAMTAHASPEYRQRCLDAGMSDFVTKPIVFNDLFATLRKWVKEAQLTPIVASDPIPSEPIALLDTKAALARMNGNVPLLKKLLAMFPKTHANTERQLRDALARGDYKSANLIAHSTAGAAGNLSAMRLWIIARELEDAILRVDNGTIETLLPRFAHALTDTNAACADFIVSL